jgi:hypothetical protein
MKNLNSVAALAGSRADFVIVIEELLRDLEENGDEWENPDLHRFLDAMSRWVLSLDHLYSNLGRGEVPVQPSWRLLCEMFLAARIYE